MYAGDWAQFHGFELSIVAGFPLHSTTRSLTISSRKIFVPYPITISRQFGFVHIPNEHAKPFDSIDMRLHTNPLINGMNVAQPTKIVSILQSNALNSAEKSHYVPFIILIPSRSKPENVSRHIPIISCVRIASHNPWCHDHFFTIQCACSPGENGIRRQKLNIRRCQRRGLQYRITCAKSDGP